MRYLWILLAAAAVSAEKKEDDKSDEKSKHNFGLQMGGKWLGMFVRHHQEMKELREKGEQIKENIPSEC